MLSCVSENKFTNPCGLVCRPFPGGGGRGTHRLTGTGPFLVPGGYWYNCCTDSNLNGVFYRHGEHNRHLDGITWYGWHGSTYSLKRVEMKIRPEDFQP